MFEFLFRKKVFASAPLKDPSIHLRLSTRREGEFAGERRRLSTRGSSVPSKDLACAAVSRSGAPTTLGKVTYSCALFTRSCVVFNLLLDEDGLNQGKRAWWVACYMGQFFSLRSVRDQFLLTTLYNSVVHTLVTCLAQSHESWNTPSNAVQQWDRKVGCERGREIASRMTCSILQCLRYSLRLNSTTRDVAMESP